MSSREGSHAALSARYRFDPRTAQLIETANPVVQHRLDYFESGNVKTQEWVASAGSYRTSTSSSLNGLLTGFVDVNNLQTTYDYDSAARPVQIEQGPVSAHYTYGPRGDLLTLSVRDSASRRSQTTRLVHDEFGREIKRSSLLSDGSELVIEQVFGADDKLRQRSLTHGDSTRADSPTTIARGWCAMTARARRGRSTPGASASTPIYLAVGIETILLNDPTTPAMVIGFLGRTTRACRPDSRAARNAARIFVDDGHRLRHQRVVTVEKAALAPTGSPWLRK